MRKRICVIIPAYNEGEVVKKVIKRARRLFDQDKDYSYDIVVINDGSRDNTTLEAKAGGAFVVTHILNSGAGGATSTGIYYADRQGYDIAATMDADGQHDPQDVVNGVHELIAQRVDLMIGSRLINHEGMSKTKVLGNQGLSFLTYLLFGTNTSDSQSGLRIYSRKSLERLRWKTSGYEFCSEMIWRAKQAELVIGEYPIKAIYTDYSRSKGQSNWNAVNILKSLTKQRIAELFE